MSESHSGYRQSVPCSPQPVTRIIVALIATAVLAAPAGFAATVRALSLADLVAESDVVVRGSAISQRVSRHPRLGIARTVEVRVDRQLIGEAPTQLEVLLLGGELDDKAIHVPGEAELAVGDEAVLFLSRVGGEPARFRVVGLAQGAFRVIRDPGTGAAFAARTLGDLRLVGEASDDRLGLARPCTSVFVPLELLETMILELADPTVGSTVSPDGAAGT